MSASVEDLLAKFQAEALVRCEDWMRDTMAEALEDEGAAGDTEDAQPYAKRVRPLEHRSPSPVPRTQCSVSSPDRDPPGAATGQCPASEGLHPEKNLFRSVNDLLDVNNTVNNEDLRTSFDTSFHPDCDMRSLINVAHCEDEESSNSSDSLSEWAATAPDNDITSVEDLLAKVQAEALMRGPDCLQDTVAETLENEGTAADTEDAQPCAKRVRPLEHRSPSPVPRTRCRVSSPDRDPPGAATGQCSASEGLHPGSSFRLDSDLQLAVNEAHDEDLQALSDATLQRDADSGPSSTVAVTVSVLDDESSVDRSGQDYISPLADSRPGEELAAQLPDSGSSPSHANRTVEVSDAIRMERLTQSCSAAASLDQQHAPMPVSLPAPGLRPCSVWILGNSFITSVLERVSQLPDGRQLGFRCSKAIIRWLGHNNLRWASVIPTVSRYAKEDGPPDILVVHAGESDLASTTINNLTQYIQGVLLKLRSKFPGAVVVWSQMVYRCKTQPKISQKRLDRACIKINNNVSKYVSDRGVACIKHQGLFGDSPHLFSRSGLSLTSAGKDICRTDIRKGIEKAIQRWKKSHGINA
ncbi:uncharacterized protein [Eleutherodactylus coqui]|uniref:uncharacterized protein n=1 Tax=Eleutherodactylus coqui TaxID=57060 RepID=UPI00346295C3